MTADPETQMRIHLEQETRALAEDIKHKLRPGVGFCLVLFDFEEGGNMAYGSTGERSDVIGMLGELIGKIGGTVKPNLKAWTDEQLEAWAKHIRAWQMTRQLLRRGKSLRERPIGDKS